MSDDFNEYGVSMKYLDYDSDTDEYSTSFGQSGTLPSKRAYGQPYETCGHFYVSFYSNQ